MSGWGLSPHARGNPLFKLALPLLHGSIPARAGQPLLIQAAVNNNTVYPRTRGATSELLRLYVIVSGLSPHARGNRDEPLRRRFCCGSIPARAGQPRSLRRPRWRRAVYPRTRGATTWACWSCPTGFGLSPHARGNHWVLALVDQGKRSIPARAGQPCTCRWPCSCRPVYPRTRGATRYTTSGTYMSSGLSPHARGNHCVPEGIASFVRSIPARAGQPPSTAPRMSTAAVYPRTRGATGAAALGRPRSKGLSPHARGNPADPCPYSQHLRSIPARAGQPHLARTAPANSTVYPRTRGATTSCTRAVVSNQGLSPHARGNRALPRACGGPERSIPARAGQPRRPDAGGGGSGVYPRTRGATTCRCTVRVLRSGLSPHARGNLLYT